MNTNPQQLLEKAILINPELADAYFKLGVLHQSKKQTQIAVDNFKKAVDRDSHFFEAECELAIELAKLDNAEEAREHFLNSLEINPNYSKAYFHYGLLLIKVNDIEEAKNNFDKVTEINQYFSPAYFHKAKLLTSPDDFEEAKKKYETAIDIDENYTDAHYYLGKLYLGGVATDKEGTIIDSKNTTEAEAHFLKVV